MSEENIQITKLREARDLLAACFDLLNDDITGPQWLGKVAALANCESVSCVWWKAGHPETHLEETFGPALTLPSGYINSLDIFAESLTPNDAGLIYDLAHKAGNMTGNTFTPLSAPDLLIAYLDGHPAHVFMILGNRKISPDWQSYDREYLAQLLPSLRKSISIKKRLSRYEDVIELVNKISDENPRGLIVLTPDGELIAANKLAEEALEEGSRIKLNDRQLKICDRELQVEFDLQLQNIGKLPKSDIDKFVWYKNISSKSGRSDLLITLRAFRLDNWRRESSAYDRSAVITTEQLDSLAIPGQSQLREFFQLSKAQARFASALMQSTSVKETAGKLHISVNTARSHLRSIYERVGVDNKSQLLQRLATTTAGHRKDSD